MKKKLMLILLIGVLLSLLTIVSSYSAPESGHEGEHEHDTVTDTQCDNPTEHVVAPTVQLLNGKLSFGANEIRVSKGACVMIHFVNPYDVPHDFVIDENNDLNFEGIHIALINSTAGLNGTNQHIVNIQMPNTDATLKYYCSIPGHEEAGMVGKLIVGEGSPNSSIPGYEFVFVILGLSSLPIFLTKYRR